MLEHTGYCLSDAICYNYHKMPYRIEDKIAFLSEASKILSSTLDYNVTLASVAKLVANNIADLCVIDIFEGNLLNRVAVRVADRRKQKLANEMYNFLPDPRNKRAVYDTVHGGKPIIIKKVTKSWLKSVSRLKEERDMHIKLNLHSLIFTPLKSRGKIIGVLTIASSYPKFSYTQEYANFMEELAIRAGLAVDNSRLFSEAQEALRTRDEFLSIASHELKTPLTSILLNLQLILQKIHNAANQKIEMKEIEGMIETSKNQSDRLSRLISDLLNISLISTGRLVIEKEQMNLSDVVHEVIKRFEVQLDKAHIPIDWRNNKKLVGNWDKVRLEQVVTNLISNAIKYGKNKPVTIRLTRNKNMAVLKIKDRGIGIKKKDRKHIFERFKRGANSKDFKGLGVGLYISRQIVEAHQGNLSVISSVGKGTTFTVSLPME